MKIQLNTPDFSIVAAVVAWAVVFGVSFYWLLDAPPEFQDKVGLVVALFVSYLICFLLLTQNWVSTENRRMLTTVLFAQLLCAFAIMLLVPIQFLPILTIIWVAVLPSFYSLRNSVLILLAVVATWFLIYGLRWSADGVLLTGLLYGTFHFFAVLMMHQTRIAEEATLEAERLNQELQAAQNLLEQATRQTERTRIARDLHDLLGHHLTALIINLQVAGHITEGEAKLKIEQCHSLAKLLLTDVRDAVTTLRENQSLDLPAMIDLMIKDIPGLDVTTQIDTELNLDDLSLAKALLSCIQETLTNSLRHSGANKFSIALKREQDELLLDLADNGRIKGKLVKGNGLKGLEERIAELGGTVDLSETGNALSIGVRLPLEPTVPGSFGDD